MMRSWYVRFLVVVVCAAAGWLVMWPNVDAWIPAPRVVKELVPWRISPGLDIRGGLRLQYAVDVQEAVRERRQLRADQLVDELCQSFGVCEEDEPATREQLAETRERARVTSIGSRGFRIDFADGRDAEKLDRELIERFEDLREVERSDTSVTLELRTEALEHLEQTAVEQSREIISNRIDELGLREASVLMREEDVVVEVPGADRSSFDRIRAIIARTARLEFKVCDDGAALVRELDDVPDGIERGTEGVSAGEHQPQAVEHYLVARGEGARERLERYVRALTEAGRVPDDHELLLGEVDPEEDESEDSEPGWRTYYVFRRADVTGDAIDDVSVALDPEDNSPFVSLVFDSGGAEAFERLTGANVKRRMAIVLDDRVETAPVIQQRIGGGRAQITLGSYRDYNELMTEANELVIVLRAGALPAPIHAVNEQMIGPTLGRDAVQQGALGALLGIALVLIYMGIYYEVAGLVANVMVLLNVVLLLAILAFFEATLTLPGIAGIALTVGMAVDANVLINERMREELRAGKSPRTAVDRGFSKAFSAILDSQLTTLIAGIVLFQFGTGAIRGFAVTLMIGIVTSIFTSVFCARVAFEWLVRGLEVTRLRVGRLQFFKPDLRVDIMKRSRRYLLGAGALTVVGLLAFVFPGPNLGTDFTGGTEMQLAFRGDVTSAELRRALSDLGYSSPDVVEVQGKPREYIVRVQEVSTVPSGFEARARTALSAAAGNLGIEAVQVSPGGERLTFRASGELDVPSVERALESAGVDVRGVTVLAREEAGLRYEARLASVGDRLTEQLGARLGERGPEAPLRVEWVGARAGEQLRESAGKALIYTLAFIMVYIAFRFDLRFAPAAIFALVHAVIVAAGVYVLLGREVNLTFVAALLTVIGYGVNDTVVVFDRIRENLGRMKSTGLAEIVNTSVSQNFSRTIMTGGSVMLSLAAFFVWGTPAIRDLSLALLIGIVTTTYASVLVAAPLTEWFDRRFFRRSKAGATTRPVRTG